MEVRHSTPSELVLSYPRLRPTLFIIFGALIFVWGGIFWANVLDYQEYLSKHANSRADSGEELPGYAVRGMMLPIVGGWMIVDAIRRLATRRVFDATRGVIRRESLFGHRAWKRDHFRAVSLSIDSDDGQKEILQIGLLHKKSHSLDLIASMATTEANALDLISAGDEISRLLDLPIIVNGMSHSGLEQLQSSLLARAKRAPSAAA